MAMRPLPLCFALVLLAGLSACSTYYPHYDYTPRPHETQLHARPELGDQPSEYDRLLARVLTTVIGVQRASDATGNKPRVHLRVLIENHSDQSITLNTSQCQLTTADLLSLTPIAEPGPDPMIVAGATQEVNLYYPLDGNPDDVNLSGLNLKWSVKIDGNDVVSSSSFGRIEYYDTYYDGYPWFGVGAGVAFTGGGSFVVSSPCPSFGNHPAAGVHRAR
jgi:hypothetical protein